MGISTNGIIAFGVICPEGTEFPWGDSWNDIEEVWLWWWDENNAFDDPPWTLDATADYSEELYKWAFENPLPIQLENYCSDDNPMWAIIVPGTRQLAMRGSPIYFDPAGMTVTGEQVRILNAFLAKYGIEHDSEPTWLLMSYWG